MTSDAVRRQVFRRILAREAGTGATAAATAAAARRVSERLAQRLAPLIGAGGVAAIQARSLHLAQQDVQGFAPIGACGEGEATLALLQLSLEQQDPSVATELAVGTLATVGALLASFIGDALTSRLLREAWPDDFAGDIGEETIT